MSKWEKLYSNLWIRISDDNFDKLLQIQKDYELTNVEDVLALLVNTHTINKLAKESYEFAKEKNLKLRSKAS
jgi:hypothetical protein